ncbi:hypothetical protein CcaverHIS002_0301260 [Cutaneotrichosporon cavernicola]|nr:hypothetical protein CcaverHIS002_0301260 [Cutaneotrichosporon cavernicola]BEI97826.1 hypothetical protein CcaverHIS631_0301250 [Cutaneotrichosporon cavernicola]BEJ05603.1 hypothetical protein CcaverHIS641_0301250 [Cutaneotrichosporon cavernicola]
MFKRFKKPRSKPASDPPDVPSPTKLPLRDHHLDHKAFPHILEKVLLHAPHASLLRFRATCRTLRDSIDRALMAHLLQIQDEKYARLPLGCRASAAVEGATRRHPAFLPTPTPPINPKHRTSRLFRGRQPQQPEQQPLPPMPARQLELLASASVIDIMYSDALSVRRLGWDVNKASELYQLRLGTVRMWRTCLKMEARPISIPVETRVVFLWSAYLPCPNPVDENKRRASTEYRPGPRRSVLNCSVRDRHDPLLLSWMTFSREVVLVLVDHGIRDMPGDPMPRDGSIPRGGLDPLSAVGGLITAIDIATQSTEGPCDGIWRSILQDIINPLFRVGYHSFSPYATPEALVIVNSYALPPLDTVRWKLFFPEQDFPGIRNLLQPYETLESLIACLTANLQPPLFPLSFFSLEEYRAKVGEEQFRLQTDEKFVLQDRSWAACMK